MRAVKQHLRAAETKLLFRMVEIELRDPATRHILRGLYAEYAVLEREHFERERDEHAAVLQFEHERELHA